MQTLIQICNTKIMNLIIAHKTTILSIVIRKIVTSTPSIPLAELQSVENISCRRRAQATRQRLSALIIVPRPGWER